MTPDETGISLPRGCSLPSSTASLCARILFPIGDLLLAPCGESAEPATASTARPASGSRRNAAFFMFPPSPASPSGRFFARTHRTDARISFLRNLQTSVIQWAPDHLERRRFAFDSMVGAARSFLPLPRGLRWRRRQGERRRLG